MTFCSRDILRGSPAETRSSMLRVSKIAGCSVKRSRYVRIMPNYIDFLQPLLNIDIALFVYSPYAAFSILTCHVWNESSLQIRFYLPTNYIKAGAHYPEPPYQLYPWVNPVPYLFIFRSDIFGGSLISRENTLTFAQHPGMNGKFSALFAIVEILSCSLHVT